MKKISKMNEAAWLCGILLCGAAVLTLPHVHHDEQQHHHHEQYEAYKCLPCAQPNTPAQKVKEGAGEHRVAAQAVRPSGHQVPRARSNLMVEGVHGIAFPLAPHIYY